MAKPAKQRRGRVTIILVVALVAFAVGVAWVSLGHANDPAYQQRITLLGMSGEEEYLVNLWTDPHPPEPGQIRVTVQVASVIGTPVKVDEAYFTPLRPDGTALAETRATPLPEDEAPSEGLAATIDFDQPGPWTIATTLHIGNGAQRDVRFAVTVGE